MPAATPPELSEGATLLDRYTVLDRFATGGMADIYRAHDSRLDRLVCVKLLRSVIAGSGSSRAEGGSIYQATYTHFLQEARALSKLSHPNTLRIYDFGFLELGDEGSGADAAARPLQVSEFLDAGNLDSLVRSRGQLRPPEVLAILDRMAGAAAEAHGAGIIHRDIKPSNILFARVGDSLMPKLADFGIARDLLRRARPASTPEGREIPTIPLYSPRWAAPEQIAGRTEGPATDVYALALVAGFMLAGKALFDVAGIERTYPERVAGDAFVRARLAQRGFGAEVGRALMEGLRCDPAARTATPFDLFEALARAFGTPRATLPAPVTHSGGVKTSRPPEPAAASQVHAFQGSRSVEPPEQWLEVGGRRVRVVVTHERLDVEVPADPSPVRLRVTLLPGRGTHVRINLKGLTCFVAPPEGRPSPALVADHAGSADLVSARGERFGSVRWSFGEIGAEGRVFALAAGELVVPFPQGEQAVAIELAPEHELLVICRGSGAHGGTAT